MNSAALDSLCWRRALQEGSDAQLTLQRHKFDCFAWACSAKRLLLNATLSTQDTTSSVGIQRSQRKRLAKKTPFTSLHYFRYLDFKVKSSRPQGSPSRAHCAPTERQRCCSVPAHLPAFRTQEWRLIYFVMPRKELERKEQIGKVKGRRAFVFWPAPCLAHKCMCNFLWKMATDVARY